MKPPEALREQLRRHWHNNPFRVGRLLGRASWPLTLSIGAPASQQVLNEVAAVQKHIRAWQAVKVGRVEFGESPIAAWRRPSGYRCAGTWAGPVNGLRLVTTRE